MGLLKIFIPTVVTLILTNKFSSVTLTNMVLQTVVFLLTAHLPALLTGRMSYVDIAWPWGLVTLSLLPLLSPPPVPLTTRACIVMAAYFLAGFRMALGRRKSVYFENSQATNSRGRDRFPQWEVHGGVPKI